MNCSRFFKKKNIADALQNAKKSELKRTLGAFQLVMLGLGAIVGAGIFVLAGAGANAAGPAVILSFIVGSIACMCAAMCYAEMASMIPLSGGAYTYTYVTLGELPAWLVGSLLVVGNLFMVASVAVGWTGYVTSLLEQFHIYMPAILTTRTGVVAGETVGVFNFLSSVVVLLIGSVLYKGVETSATVNNIIVVIKVTVLTLFIVIGACYINPDNWSPFIPDYIPATGQFGIGGVFGGAAIIFFAFNGFDTVASAAQETKNPQRDLPIGVIGSLLISTVIYILVTGVLIGVVNHQELNTPQPLAIAINVINMPWLSTVIKIGAIFGLSSVVLAMSYSVIRIMFAMSNDGLLPSALQDVHKKNKTPHKATIVVTLIVLLLAGMCPLDTMVQIGNFCVISIFIVVCAITIYSRYKNPTIEREFKCPMMPFIPILGIILFVIFLINMPNKDVIWYFFGTVCISAIYYLLVNGCKK